MDIEKTIQFMLDSQARHEARHEAAVARHEAAMAKHDSAMAELDARLNRLSETVIALANQQKEFNLSLVAVRDVMLRNMLETSTLFKETDQRISELASLIREHVRPSEPNKPNAQ